MGDDSAYTIKSDVNSDNITSLAFGQPVTVQKDDGTSFTGAITMIPAGADPSTKLFPIELTLAQKQSNIRKALNIGDFVDIYVTKTKAGEPTIIVPFSSVMSGDQGSFDVYVVGSGSIARIREVKLGSQNSRFVEIISGVKEGERIVTEGTLTIQEGDRIAELSDSGTTAQSGSVN